MEQALYLKYRAQKFLDLDIAEVREFFTALIKSGRIPHAFLFTGPKGTGKTSAARILARVINCEENLSKKEGLVEPCGKCANCRSVAGGSSLDVIEIDAASNRGIDDVRELREKVKLAPVDLAHKVFIIDECHMLTTEASNALLKTLEEPPSGTVFILCTTEQNKVLPTVVSRCTRVVFRKARLAEISSRLTAISKDEGIRMSAQAVAMISKSAQGSFRDAVKLFEQVSMDKKDVADGEVETFLGRNVATDPVALVDCLLRKDLKAAIEKIAELSEAGANFKTVAERAIELLRDGIMVKAGVSRNEDLGDELLGASEIDLVSLIRSMDKAAGEISNSVISQLPLELLAVEWCGGVAGGGDQSGEAEKRGKKSEEVVKGEFVNADRGETSQKQDMVKKDSSLSLGEVESKWGEVLKAVKPRNHSVEALLRSTKPTEVGGGGLTLEVFYKFHKERLETEKCRQIVEEALENLFGERLKLRLRLGDKPQRAAKGPEVENIGGGAVDEEIVRAAEEIFGVQAV